jgi:alpha-D-ribose 1-methylphosphonate 5-triphosphate diphosphatase
MTERLGLIGNAELVLPDRVVRGWLAVEGDRIAALGEGDAPGRDALDFGCDLLIPGLVELHTDHLESHYMPRPGVRWNALGAVLAYDAQIAASGITTVFDSLRAGADRDGGGLGAELVILAEAVEEARGHGALRAEHRTHLRCEVPAPDVVATAAAFAARFPVGLISLMDHTPGQRQFRDLATYGAYYGGKTGRPAQEVAEAAASGAAEAARRAVVNRPALAALARTHGIPVASHDDATEGDAAQAAAEGAVLAEFPTTLDGARACRAHGMLVMMGAPNLLRGGSHSGNVAAEALAREGLLDVLSSDYVPASLLTAALGLPDRVPGITLPEAVATVTRRPALAVGLADRGALAPGLRADLVRVRRAGAAVSWVRQVWRGGVRVA